ncbi:MAG: VOC family protein [Rhodospirillaceae bacterium]|nr:VOC family protein [Rhodospirillaceae bacterium]
MTKSKSPVSRRTFGTLSSVAALTGLAGCSDASEDAVTSAATDSPREHLIDAIYQTCFVVTDMEASIKEWTEKLKIGPFLVFESFVMNDKDGAPLPFDIKIGLAYSGDSFIELIQPNDDRPSIYSDVANNGGGFHHIAKLTNDLDASIAEAEAAGYPLAVLGHFEPGNRLAYVDARATYGGYMEYVEYNEFIGGLLHYMRDAAENWDGVTPTMPFPE